jgi:tRNA(Arg) A34 adenosine deaminase TadA
MIARFDHRPMLTAVLALSTTVLVGVVITLAALLIMSAPPAATSSSESGGANAGAVVVGTSENYGEGWNNYGHDAPHDAVPPQPAQPGNGVDSAAERHAEMVAALSK